MKIGVLGSGQVGQVLADGFLSLGHEVMRGSREPEKLEGWLSGAEARGQGTASIGTFQATAKHGELLVLAVKGAAAVAALKGIDPALLRGKTILDTTNPIADVPPVDGVISFFTDGQRSLMEILQDAYPEAHFVKCFSSVGNALMFQPKLPSGPPTMFICGNSESAKAQTRRILTDFGWESCDMGTVVAARAIESLCILWCIPGFRTGSWKHAFKLLSAS